MASSKSKRAQGGGRTPNSEPRLQVFKDFSGINFENASYWQASSYHLPRMDEARQDGDQTDLQMNYMFLQNNVSVSSNKTLKTRNSIVKLFNPPTGKSFRGAVCLIGDQLYASVSSGNQDTDFEHTLCRGSLSLRDSAGTFGPIATTMSTYVPMQNHEQIVPSGNSWRDIFYYDNKLIGLTQYNEMWTSPVNQWNEATLLENTVTIPNPTIGSSFTLTPKGSLQISNSMTNTCPFRIMVAFSYVNKFGPTKVSPNKVFYANYPVSEWHAKCYLRISDTVPGNYGIEAVELYYASDNATQLLFLGRVDISSTPSTWTYDWYGYLDATSMWPTANLIAPTENYTKGVHASRITCVDGRLYFWGGDDQPQRLYIGGNPGNLLSVSPGTGGGFVDVEPGTGQIIKDVHKYKTQSGNSIVTMLCSSDNTSRDQRFNLVENSISLSNEQSMKSWQAEQVAGAVGCRSYDGSVVCQDGLYSVTRYGLALTTMTMEYNSQIKTTYVSDPIKQVFTDMTRSAYFNLTGASVLEIDGVLYMAFGKSTDQGKFDNVLFCYDIDAKAWWTYTLDVNSNIMNLFHVDYHGTNEGIGIVTSDGIWFLPTVRGDEDDTIPSQSFLIQTAQISTQMPQQGWQYLSQLEFHFDQFIGSMDIELRATDMFGRDISVKKHVSETSLQYDYVVHMRVDQRLMSYVLIMSGQANFRMTHFIARVYTLSNKIGQVWGFDDSISHRSPGDVQQTFKCYNDIREAIFT